MKATPAAIKKIPIAISKYSMIIFFNGYAANV